MTLKEACQNYFHKGFIGFEYTTPTTGVCTIQTVEGKYEQKVSIEDGRMKFGEITKI